MLNRSNLPVTSARPMHESSPTEAPRATKRSRASAIRTKLGAVNTRFAHTLRKSTEMQRGRQRWRHRNRNIRPLYIIVPLNASSAAMTAGIPTQRQIFKKHAWMRVSADRIGGRRIHTGPPARTRLVEPFRVSQCPFKTLKPRNQQSEGTHSPDERVRRQNTPDYLSTL